MLSKPSAYIAPLSLAVKNLPRALTLSVCLAAGGLATTAHASSYPMVERVIKVKIKASDIATQDGVIAVYERLERKAKRECQIDRATLIYTRQTLDACVEDLLVQFVASSKVQSLKDYHEGQTSVEKQTIAMNTKTSQQN